MKLLLILTPAFFESLQTAMLSHTIDRLNVRPYHLCVGAEQMFFMQEGRYVEIFQKSMLALKYRKG